MKKFAFLFLVLFSCVISLASAPGYCVTDDETLPALKNQLAPQNFHQMWAGFDPRAEPLETEILKQWEEDGVQLKIVRFRIGIFKGQKATLAAVYGFPAERGDKQNRIPGLVQIHGGGQYADYKACLANAKRGFATISIAWAGRISAPGYRVTPDEVKLFWEGKTDHPNYRETTNWGALDGYHAPAKNKGNQFPSAKAASWTLDEIESPRNSGWFLCALAARRALTFLERQPEVDPNRLGVYGHSMGGKLTVMTAVDPRVKAAAPSCGGISDRDNRSPLFRATIGDDVSLKQVNCPIIFLSPANDFHGRIGDLPNSIKEIQSKDWRVTCSPHHNHQDTDQYEVATMLWFDQHLKGTFKIPTTPSTSLDLSKGIPQLTVRPDASKPVLAVDVFYTQQGKADERPEDRLDTMHRFWHQAVALKKGDDWKAVLPVHRTDRPLWVFANVRYKLNEPVAGVGYYYGDYEASEFNLTSLLKVVSSEQLVEAGISKSFPASNLIEDFKGDWEKEWFSYRPEEWARTTNKLNADPWKAPAGAKLALEVQADQQNKLVLRIDDYVAEVQLSGGEKWQQIQLSPTDFKDYGGQPLKDWNGIRQFKLTPNDRLRPGRGQSGSSRVIGANWKGPAPKFRNLQWNVSYSFLDLPLSSSKVAVRKKKEDNAKQQSEPVLPSVNYNWTRDHMHVGVRWQPFIGRPGANVYDAKRPVIATDSSYVQFWASWAAVEPTTSNCDYHTNPSPGLQALEHAVDVCKARGIKVEFVFFHCPRWASESGKAGGYKPKAGLFEGYAKRMATHFKGRVHAWQLSHEANLQGLMRGADIDFVISDILTKGAQAIRAVYGAEPATPVLISTTGMSPCAPCETTEGLKAKGGKAVLKFYDMMIAHPQLMETVDALNMNVSDHGNGSGRIDDDVPTVWDQYDLVRMKLDRAGFRSKSILSAESWIVWDDANNGHDVNGDGKKNEQDAFQKAITIMGQCLQRGLNTVNLPWSDNSSSWAMGLTKRRDYNGRVEQLNSEIVIPAIDGGPGVITRKLGLRGPGDQFILGDGSGAVFTVDDYLNPPDPNHLHYYVWRWYAQLTGGSDEVIRHALAGEQGNDIRVTGPIQKSQEYFRISSYNRTREVFTVLIYMENADGSSPFKVSIPARIQNGKYYNNESSSIDFRGEGFADGESYAARIITKDISREDGSDLNPQLLYFKAKPVGDQSLSVVVPNMNRFTAIEFFKK